MGEFTVKSITLNDEIKNRYTFISQFVNGFAAVETNRKWGFIDEKGNEICPIKYAMTYRGNIIDKIHDIRYFHEGVATVALPLGEIICGKNKYKTLRYGYINTKGEEVCPCIYLQAFDFHNGRAYVIAEDGKWWLINKEFQKITERGYDEIRDFYEGCAVVKLGDYYGFIAESGKEMCEIKYSYMSCFTEYGYAQITIPGKKFDRTYWIDTQGKEYFLYFDSNEMKPLN